MLQWLETIISTALRKKPAEDKVKSMFSLDKPEPLVCFALCIGALSDPVSEYVGLLEQKNSL
jgi:hypothetical protein